MIAPRLRAFFVVLMALLFIGDRRPIEPTGTAKAVTFGKQPLRFEANVGQVDGAARFVARRGGAQLSLADEGATLKLRSKTAEAVLSFKVAGGRAVEPVASAPLPTKVNYLVGNDAAKWHPNVATFGRVTYPSVLDGIDVVYHGEEGQLEYDVIVAPGADASTVALEIGGTTGVDVTKDGDLAIHTKSGDVLQQRPRVYQHDDSGAEHEIVASYRVIGKSAIGFEVAAYDRARPLVIDPVFAYSTYLGGSGLDYGQRVVLDAAGNAFVVGYGQTPHAAGSTTQGPGGNDDAFVAKVAPDGTFVYVTYVGGTGEDHGLGITLDGSGLPLLTGYTSSADFPVTASAMFPTNHGQDAFVAALNADGSGLTYATYIESSCDSAVTCTGGGHTDVANGVGIADNTVYLTGQGFTGMFVYAFDRTTQALVYRASFGGAVATAIAVDSAHDAYVVGAANQTFTGVTPATAYQPTGTSLLGFTQDAVFMKLGPTGTVLYGTYLGGNLLDTASDVAIGPTGDAFITGDTSSETASLGCGYNGTPFPTTPNAVQPVNAGGGGGPSSAQDAFVARINPSASGASSLVFSTYLGGTGDDAAYGIALDAASNVFVVGSTSSADFPTVPATTRTTSDYDVFVAQLSPDGTMLRSSTSFGGPGSDRGSGISARAGSVVVAGDTESSTGFPLSHAAQPTFGGSTSDAFIAKLTSETLTVTPKEKTLFAGATQPFTATGGSGYTWSFQSNESGGTIDPATGVYKAGAKRGTDSILVTGSGGGVASATVHVILPTPLDLTPTNANTTPRGRVVFTAGGGLPPYTFTVASNASGGTIGLNGVYYAGPRGSVTDTIRLTDSSNQSLTATVHVGPGITISPATPEVVAGGSLQFTATGGMAPYSWAVDKDSDATIDLTTGAFTAGGKGTVVVGVRDSVGNLASVNVSVGGAIAISPSNAFTFPKGTVQLAAIGGKGSNYNFTVLTDPPTGGTIDAGSGLFTAGPTGNVVETIEVRDPLGNHAITYVNVGPGLSLSPAKADLASGAKLTFSAAGGSGEGYAFAITANVTGGTVGADGIYTAGSKSGTDTVTLTDSVGNQAVSTIAVNAPATTNPDAGASTSSGGTSSGGSGNASSSGNLVDGGTISVGGDNGGCSCSEAPGHSTSEGGLGALVLAGITTLASRRRRR